MLYDMAQNPGQKMKNIYHALLNNGYYEQAIFLHERYGGLEQINREILKEHFFFTKKNSGELNPFDKFFCLNILPHLPNIWLEAHSFSILDSVLKTVLEHGGIPNGEVMRTATAILHLRDFLLLVDELEEDLVSDSFFTVNINVKC